MQLCMGKQVTNKQLHTEWKDIVVRNEPQAWENLLKFDMHCGSLKQLSLKYLLCNCSTAKNKQTNKQTNKKQVTLTVFWSSHLSCMPVYSARDTLQTSKDASKLNYIFSVVEKLLPFVKTCRRPITHLSLLAGAVPWLHGEVPEMYVPKYLDFQQF